MKPTNLFRKTLFAIFTMILLPLWGQQPVFKNLKLLRPAEFKIEKKGTHPVALRAMRKGEKPGAFKGVKTKFKP